MWKKIKSILGNERGSADWFTLGLCLVVAVFASKIMIDLRNADDAQIVYKDSISNCRTLFEIEGGHTSAVENAVRDMLNADGFNTTSLSFSNGTTAYYGNPITLTVTMSFTYRVAGLEVTESFEKILRGYSEKTPPT